MIASFRKLSGLRAMNAVFGAWTALVLLFLYIPIGLLVLFSFNTSKLNVRFEGFTFKWYEKLFSDRELLMAAKNSLIVAAGTTTLSVVLGTVGAWLLHRYRFRMARAITALIYVPMVIPEIIIGISLLILFNVTTHQFELWQNLPGVPDWLRQMEFGRGYLTLIISHVTFCFPFVLVAVQARLAGVDPALEEAAMDLGATPLRAFWHVMVPYMMPAIISGALMAFTLSMDELVVSFFTSGPQSQTLPLKIFGRVKKSLDPSLNAVSTLLVLLTVLMAFASEFLRRGEQKLR